MGHSGTAGTFANSKGPLTVENHDQGASRW